MIEMNDNLENYREMNRLRDKIVEVEMELMTTKSPRRIGYLRSCKRDFEAGINFLGEWVDETDYERK